MQKENRFFSSRMGFVVSSVAMAVGMGNIWRFPRLAAANGGGAFVLILLGVVILIMVPLLMAEMAIGRYTRKGAIASYADFMGGKRFSWVGAWMSFVCLLILSYYSVLVGWSFKYVALSLGGTFRAGVDTAAIWQAFTGNPVECVFYHLLAMLLTLYILSRGVIGGIEKFSRILLPGLFILLTAAAIRALTLPGAWQGVQFLFHVDQEALLNPKTWLEALTQAAWSTSAGWALLMTYAIYSRPKADVAASMFVVGFADVGAALIAGLAILPTIFAVAPGLGREPSAVLAEGSFGLTFIYITELFAGMRGGVLISVAFFLSLAFAGLSSLFAMMEVGVANLVTAGVERRKAVGYTVSAGFVLGIPSALSMNFLDNQDWVWSVGLLICGMFTAMAAWRFGVERVRTVLINHKDCAMKVGKWFNYCIYAAPFAILAVLVSAIRQSIQQHGGLGSIAEKSSVATMCFQWAITIAAFLLANKWLGNFFNPSPRERTQVGALQKEE